MNLAIDITIEQSISIVKTLKNATECETLANSTITVLHNIINSLYDHICKTDTENEQYRQVIEDFLIFEPSPDPELDTDLYAEEDGYK